MKYHGNAIRANVGNTEGMDALDGVASTTPGPIMEIHNRNTSLWAQIPGAHIFMPTMRVRYVAF